MSRTPIERKSHLDLELIYKAIQKMKKSQHDYDVYMMEVIGILPFTPLYDIVETLCKVAVAENWSDKKIIDIFDLVRVYQRDKID